MVQGFNSGDLTIQNDGFTRNKQVYSPQMFDGWVVVGLFTEIGEMYTGDTTGVSTEWKRFRWTPNPAGGVGGANEESPVASALHQDSKL